MKLPQDLVETVTSTAFVQNLGWLLIHSLWQCMLIALVAICIARAMRSSSTRYWIFSLALSLMVIAPVVTMLVFPQKNDVSAVDDHSLELASAELKEDFRPIEGDDEKSSPLVANEEQEPVAAIENSDATRASVQVTESIATSWSDPIKAVLNPWLPTIVAVWCCGVLLFSVRPIWGWLMVRCLLREGTSPVAMHVQEALLQVREKMQVRRRVEVLASTLVGSPIVVGCFRSVILIPASFVFNLPIAQLEAILAHELAHVRRYDYLINLLQTLVETIFFYHPAVWWLSHRIRIERENCCDDLVVAVLDNKAEYGRALLAVEEFRGQASHSALALSARDGSLLHRIRRLLAAPSVGDQRMSAGLAAVAIAGTGLMIAMVWWSTMASAQNGVGELPFGEASHGLIARIVALRPDVDDYSPNLTSILSEYETPDEMTFGVELKNTGQKPVTLALPNQKSGLMVPIWFQLQFLDLNGKPIPRTQRELYTAWQFAANSTSQLMPEQSLTVVLRPAGYRPPFKHELPAGKYRVKVRYRGPDAAFKKSLQEHWPDSKVLQAWEHSVESNEIDFVINMSMPRLAPEQLNWGKPQGGLQAAVEFRTSPVQRGNPHQEPGIPVGSSYWAVYHIKNVGDRSMCFVSETGRQDDRVVVVNEQGDDVPVKDVWFSGWPIDVAWTLEPNEIAELDVLTPSISGISEPGRYNVRYIIRFNSRVQKDAEGKVIFPRPGDYDQELETGAASLFLTSALSNAAADKPKAMESTRAGRWQITDDAELKITQKTFHAADVMTSGVIRLKGDKDHPRHVPLSIAMDHFANRERWKAVWEQGQPVLWYAKGLGNGPGRILPPGTRVKIEELRRIDFRNPDCIVHHVFSSWVADQLPSAEIRAALEEEFEIKLDGQEHHRYYESAQQGLQPDVNSQQLFVWVGENGNCQVQDLAWVPNTGESREIKCDLKTLPETLDLVQKKFRTKAGQDVPIYAFVTSRPDLPAKDLKTVLDACRQHGLKTPEFPSAGPPNRAEHGLNRLRNVWREFYAEQPAGDSTFARNAFVDLTGKSPSNEELLQFVDESATDKRFRLIERLLAHEDFEKFQSRLSDESDAFQTQQKSLPPRILRGPQAKLRAEVYQAQAGKPVNGLTLAVALRSATNRFRIGERIPLDVLVLNTSREVITHDFSFDFIANPPRLLDESGNEVPIEELFLTGTEPLYRETLRSGDTIIYPHIGLGLGVNPQPGENWHPHTPVLKPGKYRLTQQWNGLTSGEVEFEVVSGDSDNARADPKNDPAWLRFCPGTQIVERTDNRFVSGVVVEEEGRPIAGCSVEHPGLVNSKTDDQGKFQYKQSTPHRTVLRAYHPDYRVWHGAPELGDVLRIVLRKKPKVQAVNGTRVMTVRVIDSRTAEPVPHVKVTASRYEGPQNGTVAATAVTNQDGTAMMRGLDFIQHRLLLSADQPVSYIGSLAHPSADEHEVVMLVDRACELVLRAVDSETGNGIAGVVFDRENAAGERWQQSIDPDILGGRHVQQSTITDADGYFRCLVSSYLWSYMIRKYPEGYDSIVPIDGRQEVEIETPVGGKVEYTFRLVESRSQTNANGATGARTKQQIVAAWTQRARDVEHSRLSWTENRIYPRGELISPNQAQPPADDFTVQWKKSLVISGEKCRVEGVGKTWLDRIGDFAPFEFTAVRNGTGSSLHHFPGQPESLGYSTPSLAGLCDVTYRPAMLGMNPADPEFGRIKLDDYHVEPDQVDIDGRMCLKLVRKDGRNVDTHVFLDPNRQFVVTRTVGLEGGQIARSFDLSYRQDERGVWYPAAWRLEIMNGTDSGRGFHITVVSTRFESQYDADPRSFAIEYPDGTQFHNLGKRDRRVAEKATAWKTRRPDSTESSSNEKGEILDDDSVLLSLPSPNNSTPVAKFKFSATEINMLRLELLPDTRFGDRRLGRILGRTLKLFEVKLSIASADGASRTFDWDKCLNLRTPNDEVSTLIDHASDTGWTVPPLAKDQAAHELIFQLKTPLELKAGESLAIELDSGGSNELDTIARFRVSFPTQDKPASREKK